MALQTKEGALHFSTWAGPGRIQRTGEVGVNRGALQTGNCQEKSPSVWSGTSQKSEATIRLNGREGAPNGQRIKIPR